MTQIFIALRQKKKKIEYFRNLAYSLEKDKKKESVYVDIFDYNALKNQEKKHVIIIKVGNEKIRISPVNGTRLFVPGL